MTVFYIFGEDRNDTSSLQHLIQARAKVKKKKCTAIPFHKPLIQQKNVKKETAWTNADRVSAAVKARMKIFDEKDPIVVAHQDCDEIEPAHAQVARTIEAGLKILDLRVIAAAPAFEMEAWWYQWPEAVAAVCKSWSTLKRAGTEVGSITNVKETLRRDLRPKHKKTQVRDYCESDGPTIARKVKELDLIDKRSAKSKSFDDFDTKIGQLF